MVPWPRRFVTRRFPNPQRGSAMTTNVLPEQLGEVPKDKAVAVLRPRLSRFRSARKDRRLSRPA
jgi:hypothetical protein